MNNQPAGDAAIFEQLRSLIGKWKNTDKNKNELVEYRLSACDSVLVETWTWPDRKIEGLTLYHMDADKLMATHYCPLGNQPRLLLEQPGDSPRIVFKFDSVTNLPDETVGHCIEFWMEIGASSFARSETYKENDSLDISESIYQKLVD